MSRDDASTTDDSTRHEIPARQVIGEIAYVKPLEEEARPTVKRAPLVPEDTHVFEGDEPAADKVSAFLSRVIPAANQAGGSPAAALVPWVCDVLLSEHSVKAYGRDLADFATHMRALGVDPLRVTADHIKMYKAALLKAKVRPATIARRLSVLRGTYSQFAEKGLIDWETAQDIAAVKAPPVTKNTTPALTTKQAIELLRVIPTTSLKGKRDLALLQTFFITGCRVSALVGACVGHLEFDGVEHYLHVTEKRNKKTRKILLEVARAIQAYVGAAGIADDAQGPLFRPMAADGYRLERRHMKRLTPWRLVKHYCRIAGINPDRLDGRGIGIHSLRKTAINDAIRNGAQMHEVREFAGHSDIRTTELYFVRKEEDAEMAARRIQIRVAR